MKQCGLYVHIPFCKTKCIYCDFFSGGEICADWDSLVCSLLNETRERYGELPYAPETLYIGGGTPSLMPEDRFEKLAEGINDIVGWRHKFKEFTIEVNPDDVTKDKCRVWKEYGVNRVSMGVQTFDDGELKIMKRRHDSACSLESYSMIREYFNNVSIDLMFGLPLQTIGSWSNTVTTALRLKPEHISAYSLMIEPGTPLYVLRNSGKMTFPDEDTCVSMWRHLSSRLSEAGYCQYEISNYSLPGKKSLHNNRYWMGNPYLGIGPSAHSFDGIRIRRANPKDINGYLKRFRGGRSYGEPFYDEEILSDTEIMEEMILTRMRTMEGLDLLEYGRRFGTDALARLNRNASLFLDNGKILCRDNRLMLSDSGIMIADDIILKLSM